MAKKLSWFPLYGNIQGAVEEMRPESVGKAVVAALRYLNERQEPQAGAMDAEAKILFNVFRQSVDDAGKDYAEISAKRAAAARTRWEKERGK